MLVLSAENICIELLVDRPVVDCISIFRSEQIEQISHILKQKCKNVWKWLRNKHYNVLTFLQPQDNEIPEKSTEKTDTEGIWVRKEVEKKAFIKPI